MHAQQLSVAPMMDWTDRHCRFFHRLIAPQALLYTEMVTTGAIVYGNQARHLDYSNEEHPIALQLGGSEPAALAISMKLAAKWGYDEVNINCGCPSERVQRGAFGACLMSEPLLVRDCIYAMRDAVPNIPVTVKHRIGINREESYNFVRDFIGTVAESGCNTFIVHARNAWLKGLSPKENRDIPPLRYDIVRQLKVDFPHLNLILNGGLTDITQSINAAHTLDGIMLGRVAYHQPWLLRAFHNAIFDTTLPLDYSAMQTVWQALLQYAVTHRHLGIPAHTVLRHTLGLCHGMNGARQWRTTLSNPRALEAMSDNELLNLSLPNPQ
ncbi:MAG: tRNA dihydrouridine(20/20a) synthase DusA [Pseudomonadota bacterium]|jgi:tRNA-dihydrouridine synthase A